MMFVRFLRQWYSWWILLSLPGCDHARHADPEIRYGSDTLRWPSSFAIGRTATLQEIAAWDSDVRPDGAGLPAGGGAVRDGKKIYKQKCALCHGPTGTEGPYHPLVTLPGTTAAKAQRTIGNYWPYATTLYDYIQRAMPFTEPGTLTAGEVYALTAYLLNANAIIDTATVINRETLPNIIMPARALFVTDNRRGGPEVR